MKKRFLILALFVPFLLNAQTDFSADELPEKSTLEEEAEKGYLTFHCVEVDDDKKDEFVKAQSSIKDGYYTHICKDEIAVIIYKNKVFEFSSDETDKLNEARNYGLSIGIIKEQMPFEKLIVNPHT